MKYNTGNWLTTVRTSNIFVLPIQDQVWTTLGFSRPTNNLHVGQSASPKNWQKV